MVRGFYSVRKQVSPRSAVTLPRAKPKNLGGSMAKSNSNTNQVNLTRSRVNSFTCEPGLKESFLWDTLQPGLGVRAFASGKKSYVFRATVNGKTRRGVIGDASADLQHARDEARKLKTLASQGISPAQNKQHNQDIHKANELTEKRNLVTIEQAWQDYLEANRSSWGDRHYNDHLKAIQEPGLPCGRGLKSKTKAGVIWAIKDVKLAELDSQTIATLLHSESKTRPGVAAHAYRILFACLNWCNESQVYTGLVNVTELKTRQIRKAVPKLQARKDVLEGEQLASWFTEIQKIRNPVIAAFAQCLLITGARRGELESLKWQDIDFQWNSLTIRDKATTKGQVIGTRVIPLTPYVAYLLNSLPKRNQWVFSSPTSKTGQLTEPRKSIEPALIAAGLEGLTLHGLRRSFATLSEWVEVPAGITAQIMGHKPSAIAEKHYKQRPLDLLRMWHERIEAWLLTKAEVEQAAKALNQMRVIQGGKDV